MHERMKIKCDASKVMQVELHKDLCISLTYDIRFKRNEQKKTLYQTDPKQSGS